MANVIFLGLVSFFTDISSEMVYPILPLYLSAFMGATPTVIGIIEGIAESLASIVKLFSGIIADKYGNKKRLAFFGYASSVVNKIIILFAASWSGVLFARVVDRFGKGIRTSPRDALIAESADTSRLGRAYGLHKGLDLLGTAIGILLAFFILRRDENNYKSVFLYSLVPAFIGLGVIFFVREKKTGPSGGTLSFGWKTLDKRLKFFLIAVFLFTLGNSSNAFILLRARNAGFGSRETILLYFLYNMTGSVFSFPAGRLSDKTGRKNILSLGYFLFGVVYMGFGLFAERTVYIVLFAVYGLYTALISSVERALVVELAGEGQKASALGLYAAVTGLGLLPASIIAGRLWDTLGPSAPFICGGTLAFLTGVFVFFILREKS